MASSHLTTKTESRGKRTHQAMSRSSVAFPKLSRVGLTSKRKSGNRRGRGDSPNGSDVCAENRSVADNEPLNELSRIETGGCLPFLIQLTVEEKTNV
jgi:hypothetical protein